MRVALDATYSLGTELTGVGVYSRELLHGMAKRHPEARPLFCYRSNRFLKSYAETLPAGAHRRILLESGIGISADLFHGLNQRLPRARFRRAVTTFHDLFVMTSEYSTREFRERFTQQARAAAERSDAIICVSHFTAGQVAGSLGVEPSRLHVVHHGVRVALLPATQRERVILTVGSIQKRKNTGRLVEAFEKVATADWRLVIAGAAGFGAQEILDRIANSPRRESILVTGYVSAAELERWYARASIFAFPSLDEGFGIPVIEAMARGVPVITSDRPSLLEVSGDAAIHVSADSAGELADALRTLMESPGLRQEMAARGSAWANQFTWERAVDATWKVYQDLD